MLSSRWVNQNVSVVRNSHLVFVTEWGRQTGIKQMAQNMLLLLNKLLMATYLPWIYLCIEWIASIFTSRVIILLGRINSNGKFKKMFSEKPYVHMQSNPRNFSEFSRKLFHPSIFLNNTSSWGEDIFWALFFQTIMNYYSHCYLTV